MSDTSIHDHEDDEGLDEVVQTFTEDDEGFDERQRRITVPGFQLAGSFRPVFPGSLQPTGAAVQTATLTTPRGNATVRLPEPVVTERSLKESITKLETTLGDLSSQVAANRSAIADVREIGARNGSQLAARHRRLALAAKTSLQRLRKQHQMSLMLSAGAAAIVQRENDNLFNAHVHAAGGDPPAVKANKNLPLLLLVPMLPSLLGSGNKLMGSDMMPLLVAGGLVFFLLRDPPPATKQ